MWRGIHPITSDSCFELTGAPLIVPLVPLIFQMGNAFPGHRLFFGRRCAAERRLNRPEFSAQLLFLEQVTGAFVTGCRDFIEPAGMMAYIGRDHDVDAPQEERMQHGRLNTGNAAIRRPEGGDA